MPLKTYTAIIPGGYIYEQRNADGVLLKKFSTTVMPFGQFVSQIVQFRQANNLLRATREETWVDVDEAQCERLGFNPEWTQKKTGQATFRNPLRKASAVVRAAASVFTNAKHGLATLKDWLDDGFVPVEKEASQNRADICTGRLSGNPCPKNQDLKFSIDAVGADIVKSQIEKKSSLKLEAENESALHLCTACNCLLKLKVFVPMPVILAHTTQETLAKFKEVPQCWMNFENQPQPSTQTPA